MPATSLAQATYNRRKAALRRLLATAALTLAGLLALPTTASAQDRSPEDRVEDRVESLRDALSLSDAQTAEVRALFEAEMAARPPRGERGSVDREARRAQMAQRRAEMEHRLADILTPEQMEAFRTWQQENRPRRGGRGGRGGN
jgi:Spy/CpxP family protein refolding chaperone